MQESLLKERKEWKRKVLNVCIVSVSTSWGTPKALMIRKLEFALYV
jgi:hypothetical protein